MGRGADHAPRQRAARGELVKAYGDIPDGADRVIFFPRASGG